MMTLRQIVEWVTENGISLDAEVLPLGAEIKYIGATDDGRIVIDECDVTDDGDWMVQPQEVQKGEVGYGGNV